MTDVPASRMDPPTLPAGAAVAPPEERLVCAFNALRDDLLSTLLYVLGNRDDAQDAAQEAFLKCWRGRHALGEVRDLRAWIFRVGINAARDHRRGAWQRKSRPLLGDAMFADPAPPPAVALEEREAVDRLRAALASLRSEEQEVFLLRQNGGLTYEQIAEIHGRPVGTVKTQMRSALQKLKQMLH